MASTSTQLFAAIEAGDEERVRAALANDPDLAVARDDDGVSALLRARARGDAGVIDAIRSAVPSLDVFEAASFGDLDRLTELLMFDPALVTARSAGGATPLHLAASLGGAETVKFLLARGADATAVILDGTSVRDLALRTEDDAVVAAIDRALSG